MKYHCAIDLDYILRVSEEETTRMLKDAETGEPLSSAEVKTRAAILKMKGFEVMPCGCDNYNREGYCQGHEGSS